MKGGEYTVFNWSDVDSPSVEVRRTIQTLTMEVSQIMKVRWLRLGRAGCGWVVQACSRATAGCTCSWQPQAAEAYNGGSSIFLARPAPPAPTVQQPCPAASPSHPTLPRQGGYTHFMEKEIFEQPETIAQTMQGRVKITPLSPMKYAVPGIDPYLMPRVRMGGLVDHVSVSAGARRRGARLCRPVVACCWGCRLQPASAALHLLPASHPFFRSPSHL